MSWKKNATAVPGRVPRRLVLVEKSGLFAGLLLVGFFVVAIGFAADVPDMIRREHILRSGRAAQGVVQRMYRAPDPDAARHMQLHVVLTYRDQADGLRTADVTMGTPGSKFNVQEVPLHFLSEHPERIAVDDDFGVTAAREGVGSFLLVFCLPVVGWLVYTWRRMVYLLIWGKAVEARVTHLGLVGRGGDRSVTVEYELGGIRAQATAAVSGDAPLSEGTGVTALVDSRYPRSAVIYRDCPYMFAVD